MKKSHFSLLILAASLCLGGCADLLNKLAEQDAGALTINNLPPGSWNIYVLDENYLPRGRSFHEGYIYRNCEGQRNLAEENPIRLIAARSAAIYTQSGSKQVVAEQDDRFYIAYHIGFIDGSAELFWEDFTPAPR